MILFPVKICDSLLLFIVWIYNQAPSLLQAHFVYAEVTEAKQQFDQMAEDNLKALDEARKILGLAEQESIQENPENPENPIEGATIEPRVQG